MFPAFNPFGPLHALGFLAFVLGTTLLLAWAVKTLPVLQLKKWGLILAIGGFAVAALSVLGSATGRGFGGYGMAGSKMMRQHVLMMRDDDATARGGRMMHDMMVDGGMTMSMNDMAAELEDKTGDDFDRTFLELMIPHHQGAIDMAALAESSAKHDEIKAMAKDILSAQQREIDRMNQWLKDWGYAK